MIFTSYAQNFEDILLWRALRDVKAGFYIDVGANDPVVDSVTLAFYERGWHGINVEPTLQFHERLAAARPRDTNLNVAVGEREGTLRFYEVRDTGLSTLAESVARMHRDAGQPVAERDVPVTTLSAICEAHVHGPIHFLKVDVEGLEAAVLRGMDFQRWQPWILVIEATRPRQETSAHAEWEPVVTAAGYRFVYFDGLNRFYVAAEHGQLAEAFNAPPNCFDEFRLREGHYYSWPLDNFNGSAIVDRSQLAEAQALRAQAEEYAAQTQARYDARLREAHAALIEACDVAITANAARDSAQRRASGLEHELRETHLAYTRSLSWRVTAPLRRANAMRNAFATRVHRALQGMPAVHAWARRVARALRLVPRHGPAPTQAPAPMHANVPPPPPPEPMTEAAQRLHEILAATPPRKD